jgi:predicted transposase/invertase (TIGR01784 family)
MKYIPRFEIYRLSFRELQDEKEKLDKLSKFDNNLLAAILSFLVSTNREESKEKALSLQDKINILEDINLRRFLGIWLKGYIRYKKIDVKIEIDEGGMIMLETVFEKTREEGKIEGITEGKIEMAKKLLKKGFSIEELAELAEVSVEELKKAFKE